MSEHEYPQLATAIPDSQLLEGDETILIVDDYPDIILLLQEFLRDKGFPTLTAGSAAELRERLQGGNVALALLDIGLPDADGTDLLPELKANYADLSVVMLTAVTDLKTALECIRHGADDYLTKPVHFADFFSTLRKVLEKRRLTINNRRYQRQIEQARFRIQLGHELAIRMNTAYLSVVELDEMLHTILVGITAEEGLQFNRAFLALFDEKEKFLEGKLAIGPANREEGDRIWQNIKEMDINFHDMMIPNSSNMSSNAEVNRIIQGLRVDADDKEHLLIRAVKQQQTINVVDGECEYPVSVDLIGLLQEESFVIVPLYSMNRALGVIIADHFVTRRPITDERIHALESFASQASLAIEHCHLYMSMEHKIQELEMMTQELEKSKDLLVEAERYSAVGHMASQLAHNIRNPITSIGGTARLLARKTDDPDWLRFLNMMTTEAEKIETTLEDLFSFVDQVKPSKEKTPLFGLLHKSMMIHYTPMKKQQVEYSFDLPDEDPILYIDPALIHQALVHLIRNSIEAMPEGGSLEVAIKGDDQMVRIIIADTGIGLGDLSKERASDPFFTTKTFGTGMGLALVKRIVEDHDGQLLLEKRETGGTRVTMSLPR